MAETRVITAERYCSTSLEKEENIERVMKLIARFGRGGGLTEAIKSALQISDSQAWHYIKLAREKLAELAKTRHQEIVDELVALYRMRIYTAEKESERRAYTRELRQLLGLDAPQRSEIAVTALEKFSDAELVELADKTGIPRNQLIPRQLEHKPLPVSDSNPRSEPASEGV